MKVSDLIRSINARLVGDDIDVSGLSYDSRAVKPGQLFFAIPGYKLDGHRFITDAVRNGAVAVVVEQLQHEVPITQIVVENTRYAMGCMSATFYNYPARQLKMIGITGTNGKTTTTYLTKSILEAAGYKVGLLGTIQNLIGGQILPAKRTTPESLDLQQLLRVMADHRVDYVVMEVSSHALDLHRTVGTEFDVAIFTNLTQDHLDFHENIDQYFAAKAKLFSHLAKNSTKEPKVAVINLDDSFGLKMAAQSSAAFYGYGMEQEAQVTAVNIQVDDTGVRYQLRTPFGDIAMALHLSGQFNVYNSMAAATACVTQGVSLSHIQQGLARITGVPGRFELVKGGQDFVVIVDYAHTPDSLENVLSTARSLAKKRVIVIFGAGGDRDRSKRPLMGEAAAKHSDHVIITSDNPRGEDPDTICREIEVAVKEIIPREKYMFIPCRREAIEQGINMAQPGDVVVIAGKGHETYQEFKDETIHFDDKEEALRAIKELLS